MRTPLRLCHALFGEKASNVDKFQEPEFHHAEHVHVVTDRDGGADNLCIDIRKSRRNQELRIDLLSKALERSLQHLQCQPSDMECEGFEELDLGDGGGAGGGDGAARGRGRGRGRGRVRGRGRGRARGSGRGRALGHAD